MNKLREGKDYRFLVERELTLPDESRHYLLKGPDSNKYLIPFKSYGHYGIKTGSIIKCRVDRLNCKGEIFLEPQNPWYSEGKSYPFTVIGSEDRIDNSGVPRKVIIVKDITGAMINVIHNNQEPFPARGTKLDLTVERITKGKIHLASISRELRDSSLITGSEYEFYIEKVEKGMDDEEYFVIKDIFGNRHTISKEHYEYYGYSVGTKFKGKIIKYKRNGERTIEPENPFYKPGSVLRMSVTGIMPSAVNLSFTINLKDKFGFTHCIEADIPPESATVRCRVVMIKKGRPLLELL